MRFIILIFSIALSSNSYASDWANRLSIPENLKLVLESAHSQSEKKGNISLPKAQIEFKKKIDPKNAKSLFQQKTLLFSSLYGRSNSPYRGAISKTLRCDNKEALPVKRSEKSKFQEIVSHQFFTNDYFTLGVCDKADQKYSGIILQVYCTKSKFFAEISIYDFPNSELLKAASDVHCL